MIENGFVLTEKEAAEKMVKRRILNRMSKKVIIPPQVQNEQDYMIRSKKAAFNMLLGVTTFQALYESKLQWNPAL